MKTNTTSRPTKAYPIEDDEVIGVIHAETKGDQIVFDDFIDDDGQGAAKMLTLTMLAGLTATCVIVVTAIIKFLH